ncbi:MAG: transposase, partial [Spirochaetota bacterium]|nr:transposase [Spirochaetota bacterium]
LVNLPSYSPNLNLIERLWKYLKKKIIYNKYYETFGEFRNAIYDFFENMTQTMKE